MTHSNIAFIAGCFIVVIIVSAFNTLVLLRAIAEGRHDKSDQTS